MGDGRLRPENSTGLLELAYRLENILLEWETPIVQRKLSYKLSPADRKKGGLGA
jgi:hypothetical protein